MLLLMSACCDISMLKGFNGCDDDVMICARLEVCIASEAYPSPCQTYRHELGLNECT